MRCVVRLAALALEEMIHRRRRAGLHAIQAIDDSSRVLLRTELRRM
jgi:hypothetical protein